jgi:hypothetical protein
MSTEPQTQPVPSVMVPNGTPQPSATAPPAVDYAALAEAARNTRVRIIGDRALLFAALAKAQAEFGPCPRSLTATVRMKEGGTYTFSYAPLEVVLGATIPALNRQGFFFSQPLSSGDNGGHCLRTWLCHSSGAMIEAETLIAAGFGRIQDLGAAITYLRRYVAQSLLGVAAEEDRDGGPGEGEGGQHGGAKPRQKRKPAEKAAPETRLDPSAVKAIRDGLASLKVGVGKADEMRLEGNTRTDYLKRARLDAVILIIDRKVAALDQLTPAEADKVLAALGEQLRGAAA